MTRALSRRQMTLMMKLDDDDDDHRKNNKNSEGFKLNKIISKEIGRAHV